MPGLQVLLYVSKSAVTKLMKVSGMENVFAREFYENDADRAKFRVVPCQDGASLKVALEQAAHMGDEAHGVVRTRRGLGIRVPSDRYENVIMRLRPDDAQLFVGDRWEISGLPVTTGADAVKEFVEDWAVHPLFSFRKGWRRTWVVRAKSAPEQKVVEHQTGFAVIQEYNPRPKPGGEVKEFWRQPRRSSMPPSSTPALRPSAFPPLRSSTSASARSAPPTSAADLPPVAEAEPSLEERIGQAVAAAIAPIAAQLAALQNAGIPGPSPDTPMSTGGAENASDAAAEAAGVPI